MDRVLWIRSWGIERLSDTLQLPVHSPLTDSESSPTLRRLQSSFVSLSVLTRGSGFETLTRKVRTSHLSGAWRTRIQSHPPRVDF